MSSAPASNLRHATVTWTHGLAFEGRAPHGPAIIVDADGKEAPSPVVLLLIAAASCSGADVVSILEKMRVGVDRLVIEATGTRQEEHPRRFRAMHLTFRLAGRDLDRGKAERAVALSVEKYCSVIHTLDPALALTHELVLE